MERLTRKSANGGYCVDGDHCYDIWAVPKAFAGAAINKLAAYEDAEEQRRLVILPAVGDEMYYLTHMASQGGRLALRNTGDGSGIVKRRDIRIYFKNYTGPIPLKHVFRTRAEAQAALEAQGGAMQE